MAIFTIRDHVRCSFYPDGNMVTDSSENTTEVYFGNTSDFSPGIEYFENRINGEDKLKADRLHKGRDNKTILLCYTMLRLILSKKLNMSPEDISYTTGIKGKPEIAGGGLSFNITHTLNSFAFAISEHSGIGIDLEELNGTMNFVPVVKRFFSVNEGEFILKSPGKSRERFFLLWTRKEALLKGIGTGIVPHLSEIEVFKPINHLNRAIIADHANMNALSQYYIYSGKLDNCYLSVAMPMESKIRLIRLNEKNISSFIK